MKYCDRTYKRLDYLKEMLTSWTSLKLRVNSKKEYIQKKYFGMPDIMNDQEVLALDQFIAANHMVTKIVDRYHLKPQNLKVDLFRSKDDTKYKKDPMYLGWKKAALKGVAIHDISGNHLDIVAPPNDKILAKLLQDILDKNHAKI